MGIIINTDMIRDKVQREKWNMFVPFYNKFLELDLSKNNTANANQAIELASKFMAADYFRRCTKSAKKSVYMKLSKAFEMIGDYNNAVKYVNKSTKIDEIDKEYKIASLVQEFFNLKLLEDNTKEAIKLASNFVEEPCFLEMCPKKKKNNVYAKLAKAYYLDGDYDNAYKYLCKDTFISHDEIENTVTILHDKWDYSQKDELIGIWEDVRERLYLLEKEREQREAEEKEKKKEADFQKILKQKDPNEITRKDLGWLLGEFEYTDLSEDNKKNAEKVIEIASKFMKVPLFNEMYDAKSSRMIDVCGKLGKAYYIVGDDKNAITNLINTGRITEKTTCPWDAELKDIYKKACERLEIYDEIEKIGNLAENLEDALGEALLEGLKEEYNSLQ